MNQIINKREEFKITRDLWLFIFISFALSRILFYSIGYFGALNYNTETILIEQFNIRNALQSDIWNAFCQFDCQWFKNIADLGYEQYPHGLTTGHGASWAFFPFYSKLGGVIGDILNIQTVYGFYIITNIAFFISMPLFYLCLKELSCDDDTAKFGVLLLTFSPYSVYLISTYTESMYLMLTMAAFLALYRKKWYVTLIAGVCMTATRNLGVMLVFPIIIIYIQQFGIKKLIKFSDETYKLLLTIWFIPLPMFIFMFYLHNLTGDAFAFKNAQIAWNRILGNPINYWITGFEVGGKGIYLSGMILLGWLINAYLLIKKRYAESLFMFICSLIPLTTGINAMPRYIFGLYPTYLSLTLLFRTNLSRTLMLLFSAIVSTFFIIAWVNSKFYTT